MQLSQLRYFKTISECNNMSAAAVKLHISQPALSAAIKKLEDELGILLFDRTQSKLSLTAAGKLALTYAEAILAKADELRNAVAQFVHKDQVLSLGFADPGPMRFAVPQLQKAYPNLQITAELLENEKHLETLLLAHQYDAIVSLRKPLHTDIVTVPFAEEELMLSVSKCHPLAVKPSICLCNEQDLKLILYVGDGAYVRQLQPLIQWLSDRFAMKIYNDYFVVRQLLEDETLVTFTTKLVRNYRNDGNGRVVIPLEDAGTQVVYLLSYLRKNHDYLAPLLEWVSSLAACNS